LSKESAENFITERIDVQGVLMVALFGSEDRLLKTLESTYPAVEVHARGNSVVLKGGARQVQAAKNLVETLYPKT
jgi:phosphate starvation-inducible PhoH-like protein